MTSTSDARLGEATVKSALWLAVIFASAELLLTFGLTLYTQKIGYGYFRDEFYYIACGRHLAWGYVDHGPVVAVQARLGELLFGDSLFAIRIFSAIAGAIMVFLGGLVAWALGGRRSAQALAMLGLICCPQYIGTDGFLSMNSFRADVLDVLRTGSRSDAERAPRTLLVAHAWHCRRNRNPQQTVHAYVPCCASPGSFVHAGTSSAFLALGFDWHTPDARHPAALCRVAVSKSLGHG
jgi:hypothetical protein